MKRNIWGLTVVLFAALLALGSCQEKKQGTGDKGGGGENADDSDGSVACKKAERVLESADSDVSDLDVEYWGTEKCKASFKPEGPPAARPPGSPQPGVQTDAAGSTHKSVSFKAMTSLVFTCTQTGGATGNCFYKISKFGGTGIGSGTATSQEEACGSSKPIWPRQQPAKDVLVKKTSAPANCSVSLKGVTASGASDFVVPSEAKFVVLHKVTEVRATCGGTVAEKCNFDVWP